MRPPEVIAKRAIPPVIFDAKRWILVGVTVASFLLVLQNFALDILPDQHVHISPEEMRPYQGGKTYAYVFDFDGSEPDNSPSMRSRVEFFEDGHKYSRLRSSDEIFEVGGDRFAHEPGRILFSSVDNTDPRTNGRSYDFTTPVLYLPAIGNLAIAAFLICVGLWYFLYRNCDPVSDSVQRRGTHWRWHLWGATVLFAVGLYCNTGTLAPYAVTSSPIVDPNTGYAYNQDHPHFRVLFDFVNGADRRVWDHAIFLRRILFSVLGWPLMSALGFEIGGTLTSLIVNVATLVFALFLIRRWVGERGAIIAGWLMALYPGAAYWAGLPYPYALIFPASLLLMLGLVRLSRKMSVWGFATLSLAMGVAYLGYDLALIFIPSAFVMFLLQRRPFAAVASCVIQMMPIGIWMGILTWIFHQPLQNGNSGIFVTVVSVYLHPNGLEWWWQQVVHLPGYGSDIFFASNFIFIPALFLFVVAVNPVTARIRSMAPEVALLAIGLALFLFLNLAPSTVGGWQMKGTWIARLYQPLFPAYVLFIARWWQDLPNLPRPWLIIVTAALAITSLGNFLIVFGPILGNPSGLSEMAFYKFYDHTDAHFLYEANLKRLGRRPLGFSSDQHETLHPISIAEIRAQRKAKLDAGVQELASIRSSTWANIETLRQVHLASRQVGRALSETKFAIYSRQIALRVSRNEISPAEAQRLAKTLTDFIAPDLRRLLDDSTLDQPTPPLPNEPVPDNFVDENAELVRDSKELTDRQRDVTEAQKALGASQEELGRAQEELTRLDKALSAPSAH